MKKIFLVLFLNAMVSSFAFAQWTGDPTTIYNTNSGSVGIGTSIPSHKLTVAGGEFGLYGSGLDGTTFQRTTIYSDAGHGLLIEGPKNSAGTKLDISFNWRGSGPVPLFMQGSSGNVGINTTTPYQKFTVYGNLGIYGPGLTGGVLQHSAIYSDLDHGLLIEAPQNSSGTKLDINFSWRGGAGSTFLIKGTTGNVGIGSSAPDEKLTVKGKIHAEEVRVDMSVPGPDYVFEKDYSLLPLGDLEAYITAHKHLPEVPSASEMSANGLNIKEMNLLLLKKVEELTLHLIEANKKIDGLAEEVKGLKEK